MADPLSEDHPLRPIMPLVGRNREWVALRLALAEAHKGHGEFVLLGGVAGIGKTTLAAAISFKATTEGARTLVGRCYDLSETPPYGPWRELFAQISRDPTLPKLPTALLPPERGGEELSGQDAIIHRVLDFLAALTAVQPLVLLLDDIHWADPASLDLLRVVGRQLADLPVLLVATYRTDEIARGHPLAALLPLLVREARAARLDLRPLDNDAIAALVAARYSLPAADRARLVGYLAGRTEGNPLFLDELLRTLEGEGTLRADSLDDLARVPIPLLLRQVIDGRLARLGNETQRLLAVAAVIGQEAPLAIWASAAEVSEDTILDHAEAALAAHILNEVNDGLKVRFAHALFREALYEAVPALRRRRLHRRIGETLVTLAHPDADSIANHFQRAADPRAIGWHIRAGLQARTTAANLSAASHFVAAADLLVDAAGSANARGWLLYLAAPAHIFANGALSLSHLAEAERVAQVTNDGELLAYSRFMTGMVYGNLGQLRAGVAELERGLADLEVLPAASRHIGDITTALMRLEAMMLPDDRVILPIAQTPTSPALLSQRGTMANWYGHAGRFQEAGSLGAATIAAALAFDPNRRDTPGRWGLAHAHAAFGQPDKARREYAHARADCYARHGLYDVNYVIWFELLLVILPYRADELDERDKLVAEAGSAWVQAQRTMTTMPYPSQADLPVALIEGRWAEARTLAEAGLRGTIGHAHGAIAALGVLDRSQGDPAVAWSRVAALLPEGPATEPGDCHFCPGITTVALAANLALDAGNLVLAHDWIAAHQRWLDYSGAVLWRSDQHLLCARHARLSGDAAAFRRHAEAALAQASDPRQPLNLLAARRCLGEFATATGAYAEATEHLNIALALASACVAPYERALTLLALAELDAADRRDRAATTLDEARAILESLAARPALVRADALAQRLAPPAASPAPTPSATPALPFGLTAREVAVLRLVAEGLTDPQVAERLFVSRHTVNAHLRAIYGKLGVNSRAAATRLALEHRLT